MEKYLRSSRQLASGLPYPISAGAGIDLWDDGVWVPGRYEADFTVGAAFFYYTDPEDVERWLRIDREAMRFRWPPSV